MSLKFQAKLKRFEGVFPGISKAVKLNDEKSLTRIGFDYCY